MIPLLLDFSQTRGTISLFVALTLTYRVCRISKGCPRISQLTTTTISVSKESPLFEFIFTRLVAGLRWWMIVFPNVEEECGATRHVLGSSGLSGSVSSIFPSFAPKSRASRMKTGSSSSLAYSIRKLEAWPRLRATRTLGFVETFGDAGKRSQLGRTPRKWLRTSESSVNGTAFKSNCSRIPSRRTL
jgi:hypothetical protein